VVHPFAGRKGGVERKRDNRGGVKWEWDSDREDGWVLGECILWRGRGRTGTERALPKKKGGSGEGPIMAVVAGLSLAMWAKRRVDR